MVVYIEKPMESILKSTRTNKRVLWATRSMYKYQLYFHTLALKIQDWHLKAIPSTVGSTV